MSEQVEKLARELEKIYFKQHPEQDEFIVWTDIAQHVLDRERKLTDENKRLREHLCEFGKHKTWCKGHFTKNKCTCGLDSALREQKGPK